MFIIIPGTNDHLYIERIRRLVTTQLATHPRFTVTHWEQSDMHWIWTFQIPVTQCQRYTGRNASILSFHLREWYTLKHTDIANLCKFYNATIHLSVKLLRVSWSVHSRNFLTTKDHTTIWHKKNLQSLILQIRRSLT